MLFYFISFVRSILHTYHSHCSHFVSNVSLSICFVIICHSVYGVAANSKLKFQCMRGNNIQRDVWSSCVISPIRLNVQGAILPLGHYSGWRTDDLHKLHKRKRAKKKPSLSHAIHSYTAGNVAESNFVAKCKCSKLSAIRIINTKFWRNSHRFGLRIAIAADILPGASITLCTHIINIWHENGDRLHNCKCIESDGMHSIPVPIFSSFPSMSEFLFIENWDNSPRTKTFFVVIEQKKTLRFVCIVILFYEYVVSIAIESIEIKLTHWMHSVSI